MVYHQHFLSPSFGLVHILSQSLCNPRLVTAIRVTRQKVAELGSGHTAQGSCGNDEGTKVQSGPPAQKWQFPVTPGRLTPEPSLLTLAWERGTPGWSPVFAFSEGMT